MERTTGCLIDKAAALEGGWLHTGDLVYEDRDGCLHSCRASDM